MEQVQLEYWEMDIQKVHEINSLNEEVEELWASEVKDLLMQEALVTWSNKPLNIVHEA